LFRELCQIEKGIAFTGGKKLKHSPPFHCHHHFFYINIFSVSSSFGRSLNLSIFGHPELEVLINFPFAKQLLLKIIDQKQKNSAGKIGERLFRGR
jgi:hypothetical protein